MSKKAVMKRLQVLFAKVKEDLDAVSAREEAERSASEFYGSCAKLVASIRGKPVYISDKEIEPDSSPEWRVVSGDHPEKQVKVIQKRFFDPLISEPPVNEYSDELLKLFLELTNPDFVEFHVTKYNNLASGVIQFEKMQFNGEAEDILAKSFETGAKSAMIEAVLEGSKAATAMAGFLEVLQVTENLLKNGTLVADDNSNSKDLLELVYFNNTSILKKLGRESFKKKISLELNCDENIMKLGERSLLLSCVFGPVILKIFGCVPFLNENFLTRFRTKRILNTILKLSMHQILLIKENLKIFETDAIFNLQKKMEISLNSCDLLDSFQQKLDQTVSKEDYTLQNKL